MPIPPRFDAPRLSRHLSAGIRSAHSATDIRAVVVGTDAVTREPIVRPLGDIITLTYSTHVDKSPVKVLGRKNPKGHTDGFRTIAGTLIFATFDIRALSELHSQDVPIELRQAMAEPGKISQAQVQLPSDALPAFDIILSFTNDYGADSTMFINRVELLDEGQTFSVNDVYIEHTMQYVASNVSLMRRVQDRWEQGSLITEAGTFHNASLIRRATAQGLNTL